MEPHADTAGLAYRSTPDLLDALSRGSLTSRQLVANSCTRIEALDRPGTAVELRSVLAVAPDAMEVARERDAERARGALRGPLHGLPVLVKDNIEAVGLPGTAGSLALVDAPVHSDATIVQHVRDAGAVILGSTNCSEWANIRSSMSTSGWSAVGGLTANPWALDRSAGGSSSGSGAALAAGLAPLAIGTETDGSIVCPASVNGVVGLKPTVGALPRDGIIPISHSQDTPGPMARTVAGVRLLWEVMSGTEVHHIEAAGLRVAVVPQWKADVEHTDAAFAASVETLRSAGLFAVIEQVDVPEMHADLHADELTVLLTELHDDIATYLAARRPEARVRTLADILEFNRRHADEELAHFGQELFERAVARGGVDEAAREAQRRVSTWAREECLGPALAKYDLLLAPSYAPAWKHDFLYGHPRIGGTVTSPAAVSGYPLMSLPTGLVHGLPVAMTVVGAPYMESRMLAAAEAIERCFALDADGSWRPGFLQPSRG